MLTNAGRIYAEEHYKFLWVDCHRYSLAKCPYDHWPLRAGLLDVDTWLLRQLVSVGPMVAQVVWYHTVGPDGYKVGLEIYEP